MTETANTPKRRRRGHIRPEQVEQRLMEIAERCMEETPRMVYNKSLKQWEEDGSYTFDAANAIEALKAGKVDCVVIDNAPAKAFVEANEGLVMLETAYAEEDYAFPLCKDNPALTAAVNGALKELIADGTVAGIVAKYIPVE